MFAKYIILKSMKQEKRNRLTIAAAKLFIRSNQLPPYLQVLSVCLEFLLYIPVVYGLPLTRQLLPPNLSMEQILSILFVLLLLLRAFRGINMIKGIYVLVLQSLLVEDVEITAPKIILAIIYTVLVIVDITSSVSFDFYSDEVSSESLNISKICHWVLMILSVGHSILIPRSIIAQGLSSAGFLILFLVRHASMMKNENFKQLLLRFYLWVAICHIHIITTHFINLPDLAQIFAPLAVSQLIFAVYQSRLASIKLDQLHSQQKYLKLAYEVCKYMHGNTFNKAMERQIQIFVGEAQPGIRDAQRKVIIYQKLSQLLTRDKGFESQLLSAQIALFCNHQLLHSKKIIESIKRKLPAYSVMQSLLVFRLEEALLRFYKDKNQEIHFSHYECYYQCDQFRSLLLKSSIAFVNLWEYSCRPQVAPQKLRTLADRVVRFEDQINKQFKSIEVKCVTLSLLFVSYLFQVARDITKGNKILQALAFNEDFEINFQLDQKVFVRLGLEEEPLRIEKVGQNVSSLLGYGRKQLQGHGHQILLPQFYRKDHKEYVTKFFEQQFQGLYLYNKKTLIRHKWGYYEECNVVLRLHLDLGGALRLEGYFQVKNNPKYSWNSYLFVNINEDVVQAGETLPELVPSGNRLKKATDYFENPIQITAPLTHKLQNSKIDYHPLMVFEAEGQKVVYFARYVQNDSGASLEEVHQKVMSMLNSMNIVKFDWQFIKGYFVKLQASIDRIKSRQYIILAILSLIFLCGLLVCESYFYNGMNAKNDRQTNVMNTCTDIINYYNSSLKLGMDVNYVDLQTSANYSNEFTNIDMIDEALKLQTYNEHLKSMSLKSYNLPSLITGVSYKKPNYDMVVQFLANAYMIVQFNDDAFVRNSALTRARISIQTIYCNSLVEYKNNFINNINSLPPQDQVINYIVISLLILLLCLLLTIIVRVEWRIRADQQQTLSLITNLKDQQSLIETSKQFAMKITREELFHARDDYQQKQKDSFIPDMTVTAREVSRSEMSLRQISGRNLMEDSFNKSGILHTQITARGERNGIIGSVIAAMGSGQLRMSSRKKSILLAGLLVFIAIGSLGVSHQIRNNSISTINEVDSANNILLLYRTSSFFSRSVVSLVNLIALKSSGMAVNSSLFENYLKTYNQFQVIVTFPESSLPEFSLFQTLLTQLQYQYMCSFINCDPNFSNEVNIIYTTTVQKIVQNMGNILSVINNSTTTDVIQQLKAGFLKYQVDLMFYSQSIIRELLTRAVLVYMDSFNDYKDNLNAYKKLFIGAILISTGVAGLLLIFLSVWIVRHQWYLLKIGNLIKTESYINDDNKGQQKQTSKMAATQ